MKIRCVLILALVICFFSVNLSGNATYAHSYSNHTEMARVIVHSGSFSIGVRARVYSSTKGTGTMLDEEYLSKLNGNSQVYTYTVTAYDSAAVSGTYHCHASNNNNLNEQFTIDGIN